MCKASQQKMCGYHQGLGRLFRKTENGSNYFDAGIYSIFYYKQITVILNYLNKLDKDLLDSWCAVGMQMQK